MTAPPSRLPSVFALATLIGAGSASAQDFLSRRWSDHDDQPWSSAQVWGPCGSDSLLVSHSCQPGVRTKVTFSFEGIHDVLRVDLGVGSAKYIVGGYDSALEQGFVEVVEITRTGEDQVDVRPPVTVWSGPGSVDRLFHSKLLGRIYQLDVSGQTMRWIDDRGTELSQNNWATLSIPRIAEVDDRDGLDFGLAELEAAGEAEDRIEVHVLSRRLFSPGLTFRLSRTGLDGVDVVPPLLDPNLARISMSALTTDDEVVGGFCEADCVLEAYDIDSRTILGAAITDSDGNADIVIGLQPVGRRVGVRRQGEDSGVGSRTCFRSQGTPETSRHGLRMRAFGSYLSDRIELGTQNLRIGVEASASSLLPDSPFAYPGFLHVGHPSNLNIAEGRQFLFGSFVAEFRCRLGRYGGQVLGFLHPTIPNDPCLAGRQLSMQWSAMDDAEWVLSNVATFVMRIPE